MKGILKKILKGLGYLTLIPIVYILISLLLSSISVNTKIEDRLLDHSIFLTTNGIHLEIVMPVELLSNELKENLIYGTSDNYLSFGWGDEEFYLNTPEWSDLTLGGAFRAAFMNSTTLIHVTRYQNRRLSWIEIPVNQDQLIRINNYIAQTFQNDQSGIKINLPGEGYSDTDHFYKAKGSYSCYKTCNSWVNSAFKASGLKACLWTPFDFSLMNKYE